MPETAEAPIEEISTGVEHTTASSNAKNTPETDLLFPKEKIDARIGELRAIVANDPEVAEERERFYAEHPDMVLEENGQRYAKLYRNIQEGWEEATTAAGLTGRNSRSMKEVEWRELEFILRDYRSGKMKAIEVVKYLVGHHVASSIDSTLIPATISPDYVDRYRKQNRAILTLQVPLENTVPVTHFVKKWHFGNESFHQEEEVAIVGRIEPGWVKNTGKT